ncbi:sensor histidine kinase [Edaphobacter modestus]|uniref:histidine kinase n=1 Tax=Edaphobacter modestus TaxID=388466 RepID=A0A4Q7YTB0_9BACT|nr:ATP-binding protein [Edaphobacter modestus]RZU40125.1 heavy metal sensor kinase [Edaphobacter modestus]
MGTLGAFSFFYLRRALASSREHTLQRRVDRLTHFVNDAPQSTTTVPLPVLIHQFSTVIPESDLLRISSLDGRSIYPYKGDIKDFSWPAERCDLPCFSMVKIETKHMRLIQQVITLRGEKVRVTLAGQVDEHYDILRMVRNSYLVSIPLLLVISVIGGLLLANRTLEPIDRMTRAAQTISIRDLRKRLPVPPTGDEVQRFAVAWNELLARLETAVESLTQFTADISHDLRTTLTVMLATAQISMKRERTPSEYQKALQTIMLECEATTQLLDDLLAASRADVEQENIQLCRVPLSEVVEETCTHLQARAEVKQQSVGIGVEADRWVEGNLSLLRRLVTILVDNAIKYTPPSGEISVLLYSEQTNATLEITDTGIGIAAHDIDKIFNRFYRADTSRNRDQGGAGLGLSIAKWIVDAHRGTISAKSDPMNGTSFLVTLPLLAPEAEETL